ncbi:MAG TPA: serine/threonine-protein kinase [Dermatophilaceae bacterium]|nr:serine/threonine-protein kinase [Dermatophilaceae bacterium]
MNPVAGTVLEDRYTLTGLIASGGMGEVWAATDAVLDRAVAVKLMNPTLSQRSSFLERFRAEARYSAALDHPNITTVYDYGEDEGSAYLVMELVVGQPLSQIISGRAPLSAPETASILIQAASALEAAHQHGVVHRDVKPANILITPDGTAKLTDFGISRLVSSEPRTRSGEVLGTAQYLSPEQTLGQPATASSDIYALGVVGHEMLTDQRPFDAETMVATAHAHISEPPPQLPDSVPAWLRDVITSALAKDPADRPAGAAAMARALRVAGTAASATGDRSGMTQVMPVSAMPVSASQSASAGTGGRRPGRGSTLLLGAAAAVTIGVVAAFALPGAGSSSQTPAVTATTPPLYPTKTATTTTTTMSTGATPGISAATVAAPPAETSSTPGQLDQPPGRTRGHDKKDGKK